MNPNTYIKQVKFLLVFISLIFSQSIYSYDDDNYIHYDDRSDTYECKDSLYGRPTQCYPLVNLGCENQLAELVKSGLVTKNQKIYDNKYYYSINLNKDISNFDSLIKHINDLGFFYLSMLYFVPENQTFYLNNCDTYRNKGIYPDREEVDPRFRKKNTKYYYAMLDRLQKPPRPRPRPTGGRPSIDSVGFKGFKAGKIDQSLLNSRTIPFEDELINLQLFTIEDLFYYRISKYLYGTYSGRQSSKERFWTLVCSSHIDEVTRLRKGMVFNLRYYSDHYRFCR